MKTTAPLSQKARIDALNGLGLVTVAKFLGVQVPSLKFASIVDEEGKSVKVKVQNHWNHRTHGKSFTIDIDGGNVAMNILGHDRIIFVDYDDSKAVQLWEVVDKRACHQEYAGGSFSFRNSMRRVVMIFPTSKMKHLGSIEDQTLLLEMKKLSDAKKFNLESSNYRRYQTAA